MSSQTCLGVTGDQEQASGSAFLPKSPVYWRVDLSRAWTAALIPIALMVPLSDINADAPMQVSECQLSEQQRIMNRELSFSEFDLDPNRPQSSMWFSTRGCYASAVAASQDYLANGPLLAVREHAIITFHMSRNLARLGDNAGAARLAAASRRSDQRPDAPLDWNTYVAGFYGYLVGDLALLTAAHNKLILAGGESNLTNARVLGRAINCPSRSFAEIETAAECSAL